eukprot:6064045-Pyramimonas_sp.AAC.1
MVPRERVLQAIAPWLADSNWEEDPRQLRGDPAAKRFAIKCKGAAGWAARRVCQAMGALKLPSGDFRRLNIQASGNNLPTELF